MLDKNKRLKLKELGCTLNPELLQQTLALFDEEQKALVEKQGAVATDIAYGDHERHMLDIYAPEGASHLRPVVIFVHGGGFLKGDKGSDEKWHNSSVGRIAAQSGFIGIGMNYRLAPEFMWPSGGVDLAAAVKWTIKNIKEYGGDPENVFLVGTSAGAVHISTYLKLNNHLNEIRGAVLLSGLYGFTPLDERDTHYYGEHSLYEERMPKAAVVDTPLPLMIACAEFDPPRFQQEFLGLANARLKKHGALTRATVVTHHNHYSLAVHLGSKDQRLWQEISAFVNDTKSS